MINLFSGKSKREFKSSEIRKQENKLKKEMKILQRQKKTSIKQVKHAKNYLVKQSWCAEETPKAEIKKIRKGSKYIHLFIIHVTSH